MQEIPADGSAPAMAGDGSRLETIHELVRSGDYHVPASEIADRIINRIIIDRRGDKP